MTVGFLFVTPAHAILGDVNCDGVVNAQDVQVLSNYLVGVSTSVPCPQNADVNGDGQVNVADVLLILQLTKGLRTSFSYTPTQVLAISPSSGTLNVLPSVQVSALFSNPVSTASLPGNFTVVDSSTGYISTGTFRCSLNGTTAVYTPSYPLRLGRLYVVTLSTGITDSFGNPLSTATVSSFTTQPPGVMTLTSVNNSTATLSTILSAPISVQLLTSTGAPAAAVPVVFTAQTGNGTFQPSGLRQVTILTDNNGNAEVAYKTGTQAMVNAAHIYAAGFSTVPVFQVTTMPTQTVNLRVYTGGKQTGGAGSVAPLPLIVQATDAGGDNIQGTTVTFTVPSGQGSFAGKVSSSVVTNSTGTAAVMFTFGPSSGTVHVTASFPGMLGMQPSFTMNDILPSSSTSTYITGNVIDSNTLLPLTSVYVYLTDNPSVWERTDQNGNFNLPASTGPHVVEVDGFESGLIAGQMYPTVSYPVNAVQGMTTGLGIPAMLPELDQQSYLDVSNVLGGTLTIRSNPQWQLYVAPGQVTFQNGSHAGRLYASFVSHARIPMPVAGGKSSRFDDTIQPPTVVFNPPAQVSFPNADSLPAGSVNAIFTLDYISGAFKQTGTAVVSEDGTLVTSLSGQGITQGGWHTAPGSDAPPQGCFNGDYNFGNTCNDGSSLTSDGSNTDLTGDPSGTLCIPSNGGAASAAVTCNGPNVPPLTPSPTTPPSCSVNPSSIQISLSLAQPVIAVNDTTVLAVTVTGQPPPPPPPDCPPPPPLPLAVTVNITADNPSAVTIAPNPVSVPLNSTVNVGVTGNSGGVANLTGSGGGATSSPTPVTVVQATLGAIHGASYGGKDNGYVCLTLTPAGSEQYISTPPTLDTTGTSAALISSNPLDCSTPDEITVVSSIYAPCNPSVNVSIALNTTGTTLATASVPIIIPNTANIALASVNPSLCGTEFGTVSVWNVVFQNSTPTSTPNYNGLPVYESVKLFSLNTPAQNCPTFNQPVAGGWIIGPGNQYIAPKTGTSPYNYPANGIADLHGNCIATAPPQGCQYVTSQTYSIGNCTTTQDNIYRKWGTSGHLTISVNGVSTP